MSCPVFEVMQREIFRFVMYFRNHNTRQLQQALGGSVLRVFRSEADLYRRCHMISRPRGEKFLEISSLPLNY